MKAICGIYSNHHFIQSSAKFNCGSIERELRILKIIGRIYQKPKQGRNQKTFAKIVIKVCKANITWVKRPATL